MSRARRILAVASATLAASLVIVVAPAGAATKPVPTTSSAATTKAATTKTTTKKTTTKKTTTKKTTGTVSKKPATVKTLSTASKTAKTVSKTAKTVSKTVSKTAKTVSTTTTTTTTAAVKVRPSTAINVAGIRSAAVAALAGRGRPGEAVARARLATAVSFAEHTASAASLDQAWAHTTAARLVAVYTALAQVGVPYQFLGMAPSGFDCSGLTWFAWQTAGVSLPRSSAAQNAGLRTSDFAHALPGDIIWYPGHVELYLGAGRAMVHAKQRGDVIQVEDATKAVSIKIPVG